MLLIREYLASQRDSAIEYQICDGYEEFRRTRFHAKVKFAYDTAFITQIVDAGDVALRRKLDAWRLFPDEGRQWRRQARQYRQRVLEFGEKPNDLVGIVDHGWPMARECGARVHYAIRYSARQFAITTCLGAWPLSISRHRRSCRSFCAARSRQA